MSSKGPINNKKIIFMPFRFFIYIIVTGSATLMLPHIVQYCHIKQIIELIRGYAFNTSMSIGSIGSKKKKITSSTV